MIIGILMLIVFLIAAVSMIKYKQSPVLVILLLALAWLVIPLPTAVKILDTIQTGATAWASTIVIIAFGAFLGEVLVKTGIAESIIRSAVELAGDRPEIVGAVSLVVVALLFTVIYGVGAAIAIGVIVLPILMSVGIPPAIANMIYLLPIALGIYYNMAYFFVDGPVFFGKDISIEIYKELYPVVLTQFVVGLIIAVTAAVILVRVNVKKTSSVTVGGASKAFQKTPIYSYISPAIPVLLVFIFNWPVIPAFLGGALYAILSTRFAAKRKLSDDIDLFLKAWTDAFPALAVIAALWISCGILIYATRLPEVSAQVGPIFKYILPYNKLTATIFGALLASLAGYYRGPGAPVGTGAALIALLISGGVVPMKYLWIVFPRSALDPTTSWDIWVNQYTQTNPRDHFKYIVPTYFIICVVWAIIAYFLSPISF